MNTFDYLKKICNKEDYKILHGENVPFYMINRFFSFLSIPHTLLINTFLNFSESDTKNTQMEWDLMNLVLPKTKFRRGLFSGYQKIPKNTAEVDINYRKKREYLENYLECSPKEIEMALQDEEFVLELEKNI